MKKKINTKFILTATLTYIPYTVLWFFWHNNIFPNVYYAFNSMNPTNLINSMDSQNIWAMNFANALLVYGFVYFYFRAVKPETKLFNSILWGIYYTLSAIGFYSFLNLGMLQEWNVNVLVFDMVFAVVGGAVSGMLVNLLYNKING